MKIFYIGSSSTLSLIPLKALLNSKYEICAIASDNDRNSIFNVITSNSIQSLALNNSIPFFSLSNEDSYVISQIEKFQPDVILTSCYAHRLPQSILSLAKKGSYNIHPSLLPKFRGPNPLFWQLREGVNEYGITIHRMTEYFDAGNIIVQQKVNLDDGLCIDDITKTIATQAGNLVINTLRNIECDRFVEIIQDEEYSSYQSKPEINDYTVSSLWTGKRLFNFINAYKGEGVSFLCAIEGNTYKLIEAFSYQGTPYENMHNKTVILADRMIMFSCKDGYIQCGIKV